MTARSKPADPHRAAAIHWFNRRRGEMSAEDVRVFEVWINRDPANAAAFKRVEATWSFLGTLEDEPVLMRTRERDQRAFNSRKRAARFSVMTAALAVAAFGGWTLALSGGWTDLSWLRPAPQTFRTSVGQRATITLPDRSLVTLDTDTILHARMRGLERRIELERGQAFFQVAKDRSRPFIVTAAGKSVRATGTAFDVRVEPNHFSVTLIEGRVRVEEHGAKGQERPVAEMRPGWRLAVGQDARWRIEPVDIGRETGWHDGRLNFFNEPISGAVAEMNRYSTRKMVFAGPLPSKALLGSFRAGDTDTFVAALERNKLARVVSKSEDRIELSAH